MDKDVTQRSSPPAEPRGLRLAAQDEEDLRALSAALQDAVVRIGDLVHDRRRRAFTAVLNRFRWEEPGRAERVRAALRIDGVGRVRARGVRLEELKAVANLLSLQFRSGGVEGSPEGVLSLVLSGGGEIEVDVECIDVTLIDLTRPWRARGRPAHDAT